MLKHIAKSFSSLWVVENDAIEHDIALYIYLLFKSPEHAEFTWLYSSKWCVIDWCCYQARETTKHLMEINNLASKWLALNGKTPAPEPSHCALLEENITVNSFLAFQTNYIQFFSTQFYPFFPLPLSINQCLFVVNNPTEFQSDNGCKQSHRVTYKADPKTDQ